MLKRIFAGILCLAFGAAIIGCEANARVGDPDDNTTYRNRDGVDKSYKKTTTVEPDGDVHTKTETKIDR
jgi:hypothetical protein